MLTMNQTTGYAIVALSFIAEHNDELILAKDIAETADIPKSYLSKILRELTIAGLIFSKRGYHGGVSLARPAGEISLWEVLVATHGGNWEHKCLLGLSECSDEYPCPVHQFWSKEQQKIEQNLRKITLAHVVKHPRDWRKRIWPKKSTAIIARKFPI
jgi:Rrf2 family protein